MKVRSPLEVYKYLPGTNCEKCPEKTCMAFAAQLIERKYRPSECVDIDQVKLEQLVDLMAPQVGEVVIGTGVNEVKFGGQDVIHRHELTYFNETAIAFDIWDTADDSEIEERVEYINDYTKFYVGENIGLNLLAIRSTSGEPDTFRKVVQKVADLTEHPMILVSLDPEVLRAGAEVVKDRRPLLYAATIDNWKEVGALAREYELPLVIFSKGDIDQLKSLSSTMDSMGIKDLVLDPGTYPGGNGFRNTYSNFARLRRAAIGEDQRELRHPLMAVPMTAWLVENDPIGASYLESIIASVLIVKYADIMIVHDLNPHTIMALTHLRFNLYTDPRRPVKVESGVIRIGEPDENSPIFVTTNFALTYYTVESDLDSNNIDCYIVVIDTDGIGVQASMAGGQLTSRKIAEVVNENDLESKVKHKILVLPGFAARLQGELEDESGWTVKVGPQDSGRIPGWMREAWNP